jgi:hypothetical protein
MYQDATLTTMALSTFGIWRPGTTNAMHGRMPAYPKPSDCVRVEWPDMPEMTFRRRFLNLVDPAPPPLTPRAGGWTRLRDRDLDILAVPMFMDCWPPAMFASMWRAGGSPGYAPTVELTVHWRAEPRSQWHLALFTSRFVTHGYVEEDGELWSEDGTLVAQSRQLALFIPPA